MGLCEYAVESPKILEGKSLTNDQSCDIIKKKKDKMNSLKDSIISAVEEEKKNHPNEIAPNKPRKVKEFNYKQIKKPSSWATSGNVFQWSCRQFATHIMQSYRNKFKEDWDVKIVGVVTHVNAIKQQIFEIHGFCDNVVLKDYIDFYFKNWADYFKKNDKNNFLNFMTVKFQRPIADFSTTYNYKNRLKYYQKYNGLPSFPLKDIDKQYGVDIIGFVQSYGFITAINFMLMHKELDKKEAMKKVGTVMFKLYKEDHDSFNEMMARVEDFSPYPNRFSFNKHNEFLRLLFKQYDVDPVKVKYGFDSIDWEFLNKGDNS